MYQSHIREEEEDYNVPIKKWRETAHLFWDTHY